VIALPGWISICRVIADALKADGKELALPETPGHCILLR